jgi:hypothetical protein
LIAAVAGIGSGALGAWLTARNDRQERRRDRLLAAADDFSSATAEALVKLRDAIGNVQNLADPASMKEAAEAAWRQRDTALLRSARIDLLFGPQSLTASAANDVLHSLAAAQDILRPPTFDADGAERELVRASERLRRFNSCAFEDLVRTTTAAAHRRVARALRR